jgi:hypothetical protein
VKLYFLLQNGDFIRFGNSNATGAGITSSLDYSWNNGFLYEIITTIQLIYQYPQFSSSLQVTPAAHDIIRFGSDVGGSVGLDYSFNQQLYAIKNLTLGGFNDVPSTLEVTTIITGSFPSQQDKQNFRIMRRVPNETFVLITKLPTYTGQGLLVPYNFDPRYSPAEIAKRVGLIQ